MRTGFIRSGAAAAFAIVFGISVNAQAREISEGSTATVGILQAHAAGLIDLTVRGQGDDQVKLEIQNNSEHRLNIVLPPGLVAAATTSQGFQSMGLGVPTTRPGSFGRFSAAGGAEGFRSIPARVMDQSDFAVSAGESLEILVPSVCLNFGAPTPTPLNTFRLVDVSDYTDDARFQRALRSLAAAGTSQPVAQAVMWHIANDLTFSQLARQGGKSVNAYDVAAAARFVEALDSTSNSQSIDPALISDAQLFVRVESDTAVREEAERLRRELDGTKILGLPVVVVDEIRPEQSRPAALALTITLGSGSNDSTVVRTNLRHRSAFGEWVRIGEFGVGAATPGKHHTGAELADIVDGSISRSLVKVEAVRRGNGTTTIKVTNRLPLSLVDLKLRTGRSADAHEFSVDGLGVGPMRSTTVAIPAGNVVVAHAVLNGM